LFDTALFELFLAAFVLLLLVIRQQPSWPALASAGVLLGLAIQTRSFFVGFPIVLLAWFLLTFRGRAAQAVTWWAMVVLTCALTLLPWMARNYRVHGTLVATTTYGGLNFALGNNEFALDAARSGYEVDEAFVAALNRARVNLAGLSETQLDRSFYRRGLDFGI